MHCNHSSFSYCNIKRKIYNIIDEHYYLSVSQTVTESNRRVVIVGKTGAGKSSLANTIFGEDAFKVDHGLNSGTKTCKTETKSVNGKGITLIDTPGFFDTDRSEEELKCEIVRCITECAPGPHAFLIVLKYEKFTKQEQEVINKINEHFSEEVFKYATVLFTHGDQLPEGQTIEDHVRKNELVNDLVKKCGGRCFVVDSKYWNKKHEYRSNKFQVEELLKSIDKMVKENNGSCYTNEMLQAVEEEIQQEEEHIRQSSGNMSEEEIREQAKRRVFEKIFTRMAGTATGALLGALFGVVVMVKLVVNLVKETDILKAAKKAAPAAVVVGAAAGTAAAVGEAAVWIVPAVVIASAVVGAVKGGVEGYHAAKGADTPLEAAKRAAEAVKNENFSFSVTLSQPKSKQSLPIMSHDS
uniref:AIG1-type G domain-containing protein n=1 Tax=Dicentrarchus labrax TaxID=13489 RepID=A0A8C4GIA2_DICLA